MNTEPRLDLITLRSIREYSPCAEGWRTLTRAVGSDLDTVISIGDIAHTNGAADALWAMRCLPDTMQARRFRVSLILPAVKRAAQHTTDDRVHKCIADIERWVGGDDTVDLEAAYAAARAAAYAAAYAAARAAAYAAARAAAYAAADAAYAAERERQKDDIIALSPRTNTTLNNQKEKEN